MRQLLFPFMYEVEPKGVLVKGCPECPHCGRLINPVYKWNPAMFCLSCGRDMWKDDRGRSMSVRDEYIRLRIPLFDTLEDLKRLELSRGQNDN